MVNRLLRLCVFSLVVVGCSPTMQQPKPVAINDASPVTIKAPLRIATWNVEHLAHPITEGCKPRSMSEIQALRDYTNRLKADVVALQEVASVKAVEMLFPADKWKIVFSTRPDSEPYVCRESGFRSSQQKLAFALKKTVPLLSVEPQAQFSLDVPGLRQGLAISIGTPEGPLNLLNLHLKSGCYVDDYNRDESEACQDLARQAPVLRDWIKRQDAKRQPFMILGDLNHRISAPYNRLARVIADTPHTLTVHSQNMLGCHAWYPAPIDHIVSAGLPVQAVSDAQSHYFNNMQVEKMLSDHCAVSVDLFAPRHGLSNAVKWQNRSKEYRLITRALYRQAQQRINTMSLPNTPWAVAMDLDETVLDNSAYQVKRDKSGTRFTPVSWDNWVREENATLVPGAADFMQTVLKRGGKLALITNRNKALDNHTWKNLLKLGLPLNSRNTCLMGRSQADKDAVEQADIVNDKDLRRQHILQGNADCFNGNPQSWQTPTRIVMQVGDNIEDIQQVTQQGAKVDRLIGRFGQDIVILPNPMYGSWRSH